MAENDVNVIKRERIEVFEAEISARIETSAAKPGHCYFPTGPTSAPDRGMKVRAVHFYTQLNRAFEQTSLAN